MVSVGKKYTSVTGISPPFTAVILAAVIWSTAWLAHASTSLPSVTSPRTMAMIYSNDDGPLQSAVVADLEADPDITIYRMPVAPAGAAPRKAPERVMLARADTTSSIAVVYPDIDEPYRGVFAKIIEGIEDKTKTTVAAFPVGADANMPSLIEELRRQNIKVVIALGRHGLKVANGLDRDIGVIAGGVISAPTIETRAMSVLSLAPDPELLFARLKELMPAARRVVVVYDPQHNAWLIRLAREAAKLHGLELKAYEAQDLRTAVRTYQQILATADPARDALWLAQDATTVEDSSVLPLVLEKSWDRSLVVFSSNVAHVRRGALFSLFPNNLELGRNLASSALGYLAAGIREPHGVTPLTDVLMAVNMRTAGHLGLRLSYEQQRRFDLVFPQP